MADFCSSSFREAKYSRPILAGVASHKSCTKISRLVSHKFLVNFCSGSPESSKNPGRQESSCILCALKFVKLVTERPVGNSQLKSQLSGKESEQICQFKSPFDYHSQNCVTNISNLENLPNSTGSIRETSSLSAGAETYTDRLRNSRSTSAFFQ